MWLTKPDSIPTSSVVKPEPVKKLRLPAVAVWLRGTVVA